MIEKKSKPKYELEELLKVRERTKDVEDVVRKISNSECGDHILRSANDSSVRSRRARNSSIITNPWEKDEPTVRGGNARVRSGRQSKYSPTPSMKRGKAERLLKEHGSPPGIRVTAGGRIVPDGLSPLTSPQFDPNLQPKLGFYSHSALHSSTLSPYHGWVINLGDGNIGQIVDGEVRPVPLRNGTLQLYMPAPNLPPQPPFFPVGPAMAPMFSPLYGPPSIMSPPPGFDSNQAATSSQMPSARELRLLEQFQGKLELELKELNRNEVLQRGSLNPRKREEIVKRRIELTEQIDQSRRSIVDAKKRMEDGPHNLPTVQLTGRHSFQQPLQPSLLLPTATRGISSQALQQQFPEFVPRNFTAPVASNVPADTGALRERSSNAGLGSATSSADENGSTDTIKPSANGGMGLDGSVHQPRRSHAIAIKAPDDGSTVSRASLNPASPSYKPQRAAAAVPDSKEQSEVLNFMPSPSLISQMESLVRSPQQEERHLDGSTDSHQRSESSVNTVDFFPQNPQEYSGRYRYEDREQGRATSWMPKEGDPIPKYTHSTPVRPPNKFIYNNDSPAEGYWNGGSDPTKPPQDAQDGLPSSAERSHMRESTAVTDDNRYGRGQRYSVPTPQLLNEVSQRTAQLHTQETQATSTAYRAGFDTGYRQDIITDNSNVDFRRGYRDGMLRSMGIGIDFEMASTQLAATQPGDPLRHDRGSLANMRTNTLPSFPHNDEGATSPIPEVPANSLATTPTHARSARKKKSSIALDSPSARADFEAQPNVSLSAGRMARAQAANLAHLNSTVSPSKRGYGEVSPPDQKYVPVKMRDLRESFDQQRYAKATTSVSQSNDQARGHSSQYDGLGEDEKSPEILSGLSSPTSPRALSTSKTKANGSPVRRKASAAVATMKQVAGMNGRKDEMQARTSPKKGQETEETPIPTSPEKRAWREKWTRNFRQVKRDEQTDDANKHPFR